MPRRSILLATATVIALPAALAAQQQGGAAAGPADRCSAIAASALPPVVEIASAEVVPAGPGPRGQFGEPTADLPAHCKVEGTINRRTGAGGVTYGIGFELRLPFDWNGRYLLQGGGGLNGSVRPALGPVAAGNSNALARGFAVASHDSGHQGAVFDQSFHADQRAALDFAETSVATVTRVTRAIATGFYGEDPHHSYMTGCSTGGREGMLASQRYPELFDGIVVGAPAMRPGHSNLAIEWAQVRLNQTLPVGEAGPAGFTPAEKALIDGELRRQCDAADGRADGMIANVAACRSFDPAPLACQPGAAADSCMVPARVEALAALMAGPRDLAGRPAYAPYPWDTGITFSGPGLPGFLPVGQPGVFGPASTAREMDVDARLQAVEWDAVGRLTDTPYWTNLSTYLGHQGKLLFFHGVSDPWFSAWDTWDYFERARAANGAEAWDNAARFYMVPGMGHCGGGNTYDSFDLLGPMVDWVENGVAPEAITASRRDSAAQMPLCPYPAYAHYSGGDGGVVSSYECRMPEG